MHIQGFASLHWINRLFWLWLMIATINGIAS